MTGRIGFVDEDLNNFHADTYLKLLRGDLGGRRFEVAGCTARRVESGRAWAGKNGVPWFDDVAGLDDHVDHYVVLAPSNPEVHLPLCQQVLPAGKATYVDKTFAPDLATARAIFTLADASGAPVQTTSALRYTAVQDHVAAAGGCGAVRHIEAWGGGPSFEEYAIHPVELVVSCLGAGVERLMRWGEEPHSRLLLEWGGGRTALVHVRTEGPTPFAATVVTAAAVDYLTVDAGRIFRDTASAFLELFVTGRPNVDREESLAVRRILDAAATPAARRGFIAV